MALAAVSLTLCRVQAVSEDFQKYGRLAKELNIVVP
jgi:hypothetical protein